MEEDARSMSSSSDAGRRSKDIQRSHTKSTHSTNQPQRTQTTQSARHHPLETTFTSDTQRQERQEASEQGQRQQQLREFAENVHVDPDYIIENPWYGQPPLYPIFSLNKPFPHTVRQQKEQQEQEEQQQQQQQDEDGQEPDLERGDARTQSTQRQEAQDGEQYDESMKYSEGLEAWTTEQDDFGADAQNRKTRTQQRSSSRTAVENGGTKSRTRTKSSSIGEKQPDEEQEDEQQEDQQGPETDNWDEMRNTWARFRARHPEAFGEFLAMTIAMTMGISGSLAVQLGSPDYGNQVTVAMVWGFSFMVGIYLAGGVSGAQLNPAVSIALSLFRGFPPRRCLTYIIAQLLGGLVAAGITYGIFHDAIHTIDPQLTPDMTGSAFYTIPKPFLSTTSAWFSEFLSAAVLMCVILALGDDQNAPPTQGMGAFILGVFISVLMLSIGFGTGPVLNPARDFGPRLVALAVGYGSQTFVGGGWWWLYGAWAAPIAGTCVGCVLYDTFIFVGKESPINYQLPSRREMMRSVRKKVSKKRRSE